MTTEPVISVRGATATLGSRPVLRGIDLTVQRGEVVALLGANGSGKSTAVRSVIGQVPLTGGEIALFGTELRRFRDVGAHRLRTAAHHRRERRARDRARGRLLRPAVPYEAGPAVARRTGRPCSAPSSSSGSPTAPRTP